MSDGIESIKRAVYWCALAFVLILLVIAFAVHTIRGISLISVRQFVFCFGTGLTLICGVLWIGHVTGVHSLTKGIAKILWTVFISSMLLTSVSVYRELLAKPVIRIERLLLLEESNVASNPESGQRELTSLVTRQRIIYNRADPEIVMVAIVSNYDLTDSGNSDISAEVVLLNRSRNLGDFGWLSRRTNPDEWKIKPLMRRVSTNAEEVSRVFGNVNGKTVFAARLTKPNTAIGTGAIELRFSVTDNLTRFHHTQHLDVDLR